jgi:hypothetical protein
LVHWQLGMFRGTVVSAIFVGAVKMVAICSVHFEILFLGRRSQGLSSSLDKHAAVLQIV